MNKINVLLEKKVLFFIGGMMVFNLTSCSHTPIDPALNIENPRPVAVEEAANANFIACKQQYIDRFGNPELAMVYDESGLAVEIFTSRLKLHSIQPGDRMFYLALYGSADVMKTWGEGSTKDALYVDGEMKRWLDRLKDKVPFVALTVREKATNEPIGDVVLGVGSRNNKAILSYKFMPEAWGKGYGNEAVGAVMFRYVPELYHTKAELPKEDPTLRPLRRVEATCLTTNDASNRILRNVGFEQLGTDVIDGREKFVYKLELDELYKTT